MREIPNENGKITYQLFQKLQVPFCILHIWFLTRSNRVEPVARLLAVWTLSHFSQPLQRWGPATPPALFPTYTAVVELLYLECTPLCHCTSDEIIESHIVTQFIVVDGIFHSLGRWIFGSHCIYGQKQHSNTGCHQSSDSHHGIVYLSSRFSSPSAQWFRCFCSFSHQNQTPQHLWLVPFLSFLFFKTP